MRLVIHVGPWKTGTTTLQTWLRANSELLAGLGLLYPALEAPNTAWMDVEVRRQFEEAHHPLAVAYSSSAYGVDVPWMERLRSRFPRPRDLLAALPAEDVQASQWVLLSSEVFAELEPTALAALIEDWICWFGSPESIHFVYSIRLDEEKWASSMWRQAVGEGLFEGKEINLSAKFFRERVEDFVSCVRSVVPATDVEAVEVQLAESDDWAACVVSATASLCNLDVLRDMYSTSIPARLNHSISHDEAVVQWALNVGWRQLGVLGIDAEKFMLMKSTIRSWMGSGCTSELGSLEMLALSRALQLVNEASHAASRVGGK